MRVSLDKYRSTVVDPVYPEDFLNSRYKALKKLGYGAYSTAWLCRDSCTHNYVTFKVLKSTLAEQKSSREVEVYKHLSRLGRSAHVGSAYIRRLYDTFDISVPYGIHRCLVHPAPLHFLQCSEETRNVFDENGRWLSADGVSISSISLEEAEENLKGQNKKLFLQFLRSMLQWDPEERKTAKELLDDPWHSV